MTQTPYFNGHNFSGLSLEMMGCFKNNGVLVLENFFAPTMADALMARMDKLVSNISLDEHKTVFSTLNRKQEQEDYFLSSGRDIRFFFEDDAFDENGNLNQPINQSLNKAGHAMHDKDDLFSQFSRHENIKKLANDLGINNPILLQSMYIFKPPRIGGEVICHQDSTYLWSEPQSCLGLWFALEDATIENGCLWGIKGNYENQMPRKRLKRKTDNPNTTELIELDPTPFKEDEKIALPVNKGSLIIFSGLFPHLSGPNLSERSRHAYTLHLIDGACHYPKNNWLRPNANDPFRGF